MGNGNSEQKKHKSLKGKAKHGMFKGVQDYEKMSAEAKSNPEEFWAGRAELLDWFKKWDNVLDYNFTDKPKVEWFGGGKLNAAYNCLDRHIIGTRRNKIALIWQGDPESDVRIWSYQMLYDRVCRFASALKRMGARKGDRIVLYLPMIPETVVAMLACARIGAIHVLVFAGFSTGSFQTRVKDCDARIVITADGLFRAGRIMPLKANVDEALEDCHSVRRVIVVNRTGMPTIMREQRDVWWRDIMADTTLDADLPATSVDAEDPLFILYTSGSTGKPKGIVQSTGGYLTYAAHTMELVFDHHENDVHWCTADVGWITGHTYAVYGPLLLGGTTIIFEGGPRWPDPDRFWSIVEKFRVNTFYTAPTAIRVLMREGEEWLKRYDRSSLRVLGSVGEPIGEETWNWYFEKVGGSRCPLVDTWWQTETGGIMISPIPFVSDLNPGSASKPLPGINAKVLNAKGEEAEVDEEGYLVISKPWPGMMSGVFRAPETFKNNYFEMFPGYYLSGDGAKVDKDGNFWLMGRVDDIINVSGHRFSTAEMEDAFTQHKDVAEATVVGIPHAVKGEAIYAFVLLQTDVKISEKLIGELRRWIRKRIGPIATPEYVQIVDGLPKTRSGKVLRRVLRKIVSGQIDELGDLSTLSNPEIMDKLVGDHERIMGRAMLS